MTRGIHTVGHSNRSLDDLVASLKAFGVTTLADIRTVPRSRHNPTATLRFGAPTDGVPERTEPLRP